MIEWTFTRLTVLIIACESAALHPLVGDWNDTCPLGSQAVGGSIWGLQGVQQSGTFSQSFPYTDELDATLFLILSVFNIFLTHISYNGKH